MIVFVSDKKKMGANLFISLLNASGLMISGRKRFEDQDQDVIETGFFICFPPSPLKLKFMNLYHEKRVER